MSRMDHFRQGGTPFDGFLYANLGLDNEGNTVSVLSALARLGHDPWDEAAELSALSVAGAQTRLSALLAGFADVPQIGRDPRATIPQLVALLPMAATGKIRAGNILPANIALPGFRVIFAVSLVVLFLIQTFVFGTDGSGN